MDKDQMWDFLIANDIATENELKLVTDLNGYSEETLLDVLYSRTGNRSIEQFCEENGIELEESKMQNITSVTNKILEGADITASLMEASTVLRDQGITSTDDVDELVLYIINDGQLYRSQGANIVNNLKKKVAKGTYDPELAVKAFMYLVDAGVRKYDKEFGSGQGKLFLDKATRTEIAKGVLDHYDEQIQEG